MVGGMTKGGEKDGTGVKKGKTKMTMIRGVIIPMDWDEHGNVVRIAISSNDENEYLVEKGGKGSELLAFIRKEVEVGGVIKEEDHRKVIMVKQYAVRKAEEFAPRIGT
jgi:hypothetical protein